MKKSFKRKKSGLRSKKGMSLVEILVAVTIIVIVFGGTVGAMTTGYTTTIYNANDNANSVKSASLNDVVFSAIKNLNFEDKKSCDEYFFGTSTPPKNPNEDTANAVTAAVKSFDSSVMYVSPSEFLNPSATIKAKTDMIYTIITGASLDVQKSGGSPTSVEGIQIKTAVESTSGTMINTSFIPYGAL